MATEVRNYQLMSKSPEQNIAFEYQRLSFLQTNEWASINKLFNKAILFNVNEPTINVSGAFFYKNSTPWYKLILKNILGMSSGLFECHAGPVFSNNCTQQQVSDFIDALLNLARKKRVSRIFISTNSFSNLETVETFVKLAQENGFSSQKTYNPIVDLRYSYEEISMGFKNAARTGARKAIASGVKIKKCDSFSEYVRFVENVSKAKNSNFQSLDKHKKFWNNYSSKYSFFYSELDGAILSLLGTYEHDKTVTPISSCIASDGLKLKIPAQDMLFWEVINYHKGKGDEFFELTPVTFEDEKLSEKEKGIRSFKLKWSQKFLVQYYLELNF